LNREFSGATNDEFLSSVHYNYYVNIALTTYLIPFYQLDGLLSNGSYSEVIEVRSNEDTGTFGWVFGGKMADRPSIGSMLACQRNNVTHSYSSINLYPQSLSSGIKKIRGNLRKNLGKFKNQLKGKPPVLDRNSRSIIDLNWYELPSVSSTVWNELDYKLAVLPRSSLAGKYKPNKTRIEYHSESLKQQMPRCTIDNGEVSDEAAQIIEYVLGMFFDYFAHELDTFLCLIQDEPKSYDAVRIIAPPVTPLDDVVHVRSLNYKHARLISWQHGGNYGYMGLPMFFYHDLMNCDVFLAWGSSLRDYSNVPPDVFGSGAFSRPRGRVEIVGTYRTPVKVSRSNLKPNRLNGKLKILYACRDYQSVVQNLTNGWVMTSLIYYEAQKEIISIMANLDQVEITVQPHPGDPQSAAALVDWVEAQGIKNIEFGKPGKFASALAETDVVFCDFPSTSFLEALCAQIPVIIYEIPGVYELADRYFDSMPDDIYRVSGSAGFTDAIMKIKDRGITSGYQNEGTEAFLVGRVSGFTGEIEMWHSILD
jgi:hypothetical protein